MEVEDTMKEDTREIGDKGEDADDVVEWAANVAEIVNTFKCIRSEL